MPYGFGDTFASSFLGTLNGINAYQNSELNRKILETQLADKQRLQEEEAFANDIDASFTSSVADGFTDPSQPDYAEKLSSMMFSKLSGPSKAYFMRRNGADPGEAKDFRLTFDRGDAMITAMDAEGKPLTQPIKVDASTVQRALGSKFHESAFGMNLGTELLQPQMRPAGLAAGAPSTMPRTPGGTLVEQGGNRPKATLAPGVAQWSGLIDEASQKTGVPREILQTVMSIESEGKPNAKSPAGAEGIMQFMPATARRYNVKNPYDPAQAIMGSAAYLSDLYGMFGDWEAVMAAYNMGENGYARVLRGERQLPEQTRDYLRKARDILGSMSPTNTAQVTSDDPATSAPAVPAAATVPTSAPGLAAATPMAPPAPPTTPTTPAADEKAADAPSAEAVAARRGLAAAESGLTAAERAERQALRGASGRAAVDDEIRDDLPGVGSSLAGALPSEAKVPVTYPEGPSNGLQAAGTALKDMAKGAVSWLTEERTGKEWLKNNPPDKGAKTEAQMKREAEARAKARGLDPAAAATTAPTPPAVKKAAQGEVKTEAQLKKAADEFNIPASPQQVVPQAAQVVRNEKLPPAARRLGALYLYKSKLLSAEQTMSFMKTGEVGNTLLEQLNLLDKQMSVQKGVLEQQRAGEQITTERLRQAQIRGEFKGGKFDDVIKKQIESAAEATRSIWFQDPDDKDKHSPDLAQADIMQTIENSREMLTALLGFPPKVEDWSQKQMGTFLTWWKQSRKFDKNTRGGAGPFKWGEQVDTRGKLVIDSKSRGNGPQNPIFTFTDGTGIHKYDLRKIVEAGDAKNVSEAYYMLLKELKSATGIEFIDGGDEE